MSFMQQHFDPLQFSMICMYIEIMCHNNNLSNATSNPQNSTPLNKSMCFANPVNFGPLETSYLNDSYCIMVTVGTINLNQNTRIFHSSTRNYVLLYQANTYLWNLIHMCSHQNHIRDVRLTGWCTGMYGVHPDLN
jgi:hypothetical protein